MSQIFDILINLFIFYIVIWILYILLITINILLNSNSENNNKEIDKINKNIQNKMVELNAILLIIMYFVCMVLYILIVWLTKKKVKATLDPIVNTRANNITTNMYNFIQIHAVVQALYNFLCIVMLIRILHIDEGNGRGKRHPECDNFCKALNTAYVILFDTKTSLITLIEGCILFELIIVFLIVFREKNKTLPFLFYIA